MIFDQTNLWSLHFKHPVFLEVFTLVLGRGLLFGESGIITINNDLFIKQVSYYSKEND